MGAGPDPQLQAGGAREAGARGEVMLEAADRAGVVAAVEQQGIQIELDRMDRGKPERRPR